MPKRKKHAVKLCDSVVHVCAECGNEIEGDYWGDYCAEHPNAPVESIAVGLTPAGLKARRGHGGTSQGLTQSARKGQT